MMQELLKIKINSNHFNRNIVIVTLSILCLGIGSATGFAKPKSSPGISTSSTNTQRKKIEEYQKRLAQLLTPVAYHYNPAGKPDPFMPFFRTSSSTPKNIAKKTGKANRPERCDTPLECMDVGQLTLVGIVLEKTGSTIAMVQDASGIGYTLRPGMRIGFQHGKIVKIDKDKVLIREEVEDIKGELISRDRILFLHPEETNEAQ